MKLCRFQTAADPVVRVGVSLEESTLLDLTAGGVQSMEWLLERDDLVPELQRLAGGDLPRIPLGDLRLLAPVERQEIWAAGVTYLRSKKARMDESEFSASAYDRVYEAERPELFFKSLPEKVVPHREPVGIRQDSEWNVPEPELVLVFNSRANLVGYSIGNDMSSRDIEGENLLYLPQAKTYFRSCAIGPWIRVGVPEGEARCWGIDLEIRRGGAAVFAGKTFVNQIKRSFDELAGFLFRCQRFPHGAMLLTGTGIVPGDDFTLEEGDAVRIGISGIGELENPVVRV
jgi:2-dehydro-3-deoxy-D-arabinonate dehydratase